MKLWVKIAVLLFVVSQFFIQLTLYIIEPTYEKEIIDLYGQKVKAIASTAASHMDGKKYAALVSQPKEKYIKNKEFNEIRNHLIATKNTLGLNEEIYTLSLVDSDKAVFDIMTNKNLFAGDTLHLKSKTARESLRKVYKDKICVYTDIYKDQYGTWITGIAPIFGPDSSVVGVVQTDHQASLIYSHLDRARNVILIIRLISIPLLLILSIFISKAVTKPIERVTETVQKIALGNYNAGEEIRTSGELKDLIDATDRMRQTIVEQQQKIFASIRELKDANAELKKAKEKAETSDQLKSEFLALISHEIRTPLNAVLNYLTIIQEEVAEIENKDIQEYIAAVHEENFRLTRTIDLIVNMAEMQTGTYEKFIEEINLVEVIQDVVDEYLKIAGDKNLDISFEYDDIPLLKLDKYSVHLIFSNLIDNAVKFTDKGFVKIKVATGKENSVIAQVEDSGIGISEEFMPELFKIFSQEDHGYSRRYDGNGLGMALVKKSCEINSVDINIKSEKNRGTCVELRFKV